MIIQRLTETETLSAKPYIYIYKGQKKKPKMHIKQKCTYISVIGTEKNQTNNKEQSHILKTQHGKNSCTNPKKKEYRSWCSRKAAYAPQVYLVESKTWWKCFKRF